MVKRHKVASRQQVIDEYFEWLCDAVLTDRYCVVNTCYKLLHTLHNIEFTWTLADDGNRAERGENLRWEFTWETERRDDFPIFQEYLEGPCSVLEMMVSVARDIEALMDDPQYGDRTGQWFWWMIGNLGLKTNHDDQYDEDLVYDVIQRFLDRDYDYDGRGGLIYIRRCEDDLRKFPIWYQVGWYLNTIT